VRADAESSLVCSRSQRALPLLLGLFSPQSMYQECRPIYAFAERIADWLLHGYYVDEICERIKLCDAGFFDKKLE